MAVALVHIPNRPHRHAQPAHKKLPADAHFTTTSPASPSRHIPLLIAATPAAPAAHIRYASLPLQLLLPTPLALITTLALNQLPFLPLASTMPAAYQLPYWCSSSSFSQLSTPATPFTSPVIIPVGPTSPPSLRQSSSPLPLAESLPFNSLHLAAEYNLYQLKAQLVSSVPAFEIHARLRARPYPDPATLSAKRHSAASLRRTSEEKDDSKPLSIPRAVQSCAASSESSDSLRIPRWYYEDRAEAGGGTDGAQGHPARQQAHRSLGHRSHSLHLTTHTLLPHSAPRQHIQSTNHCPPAATSGQPE